jgi:hypothetical protein
VRIQFRAANACRCGSRSSERVSLVARPDPAELGKHGIKSAPLSVEPNAGELAEIGTLIDAKMYRWWCHSRKPLKRKNKLLGHTRGKIVLKVADEPK